MQWAWSVLRKPIVSHEWLKHCAAQHRLVPYDPFRLPALAGLKICATGIAFGECLQSCALLGRWCMNPEQQLTKPICIVVAQERVGRRSRWVPERMEPPTLLTWQWIALIWLLRYPLIWVSDYECCCATCCPGFPISNFFNQFQFVRILALLLVSLYAWSLPYVSSLTFNTYQRGQNTVPQQTGAWRLCPKVGSGSHLKPKVSQLIIHELCMLFPAKSTKYNFDK